MSPYIPPYVREDGTFCVVVKFETTQDAANLRDQVTQWCSQWVAENGKWGRLSVSDYDPDNPPIQRPDYFEIFTSPPYVTKAENHHLWLRTDGTYSYWWRDWLVPIVVGLTRAFPDLAAGKLDANCDQ